MKISTSNFKNIQKICNPVSICLFPPRGYRGHEFKDLAPDLELFTKYKNKQIDKYEFEYIFLEKLHSKFEPKELIKILQEKFGNEMTLLCYEPKGEFCHRHLVANFLSSEIEVLEL